MLTRRPARWVLPDPFPDHLESFAAGLGITPVAARVLWRRGYRDRASALEFMNSPLEALHDPFLMRDMAKAVERLLRAIRGGEKILLYGDYDVDGATSVVILKKAIEMAGGGASYHVPDRFGEGYGMRREMIEQAAAEGVSLIVSVDTGIRATEAVRKAAELGIDVVITDHHLPQTDLPPALAVVNPNRPDCGYPDKSLCGAGVAFKVSQALWLRRGWTEQKILRVARSLLKVVAIATVADVVPLVGENRIIVRHGLDGLRSVKNPGLQALLEVAGFSAGERPTAGQVAFRIAPRIYAAGRMANAAEVVELFLTRDRNKARELAAQLHSLNQERQDTEAAIVRRILEECTRRPVSDDQAALVFDGPGWHRGVVGIVASRLVDRFCRPVFVLSVDDESGEAQGSGRSIPEFHLLEALEPLAGLFLRFGGHRQAAGLSLPASAIPEFRERLNRYAAGRLSPADFVPRMKIDAAINFAEITDRAAGEILALEPFGFGNPAPVFVAENVEIAGEPLVMKEKHARLQLRQNGRTLTAKAWNFSERLPELRAAGRVDVALTFETDSWAAARGYPGWALQVKDARPR